MEWLFVLVVMVVVWQLVGLLRDLWQMLRRVEDDFD